MWVLEFRIPGSSLKVTKANDDKNYMKLKLFTTSMLKRSCRKEGGKKHITGNVKRVQIHFVLLSQKVIKLEPLLN